MRFNKKELQKMVNKNPELKAMMKCTEKKLPMGVIIANRLARTNKKIDNNGYISLFDYYDLKDEE